MLLKLGVLDLLSQGFEKVSKNIKMEICQSINNLMCGDQEVIQHVLDHRYLTSKIFTYVQTGNYIVTTIHYPLLYSSSYRSTVKERTASRTRQLLHACLSSTDRIHVRERNFFHSHRQLLIRRPGNMFK